MTPRLRRILDEADERAARAGGSAEAGILLALLETECRIPATDHHDVRAAAVERLEGLGVHVRGASHASLPPDAVREAEARIDRKGGVR